MLAIYALLPGPRVPAQENDDAAALNAQVERLHGAGRFNEAVLLEERSLAIREKALGPEHPDVAKWLKRVNRVVQPQAGENAACLPHSLRVEFSNRVMGGSLKGLCPSGFRQPTN